MLCLAEEPWRGQFFRAQDPDWYSEPFSPTMGMVKVSLKLLSVKTSSKSKCHFQDSSTGSLGLF